MSRSVWFVAGAGLGIYASIRARRAAQGLTPDGLRDRLSALSLGAHLFGEEVRAGMGERQTELRARVGIALDGHRELRGGFETPLRGSSTTEEATPRVGSSTTEDATPRVGYSTTDDEKELS